MRTTRSFLAILLFFIFPNNSAIAYELNGSMIKQSKGYYSVTLENEYGHQYHGEAIEKQNGNLDVSVQDHKGQSYSGEANKQNNEEYELNLQNDSSGGEAFGILILNK